MEIEEFKSTRFEHGIKRKSEQYMTIGFSTIIDEKCKWVVLALMNEMEGYKATTIGFWIIRRGNERVPILADTIAKKGRIGGRD